MSEKLADPPALGGGYPLRLDSPVDWESVVFLPEDHLGLTKSNEFANNLLYMLLEMPRERDGR